jgi:hypothetical protein
MDISRHIRSLLFEHECVIVPGLGGFVSNYAPAKIHPVQHMFQAPSKTILFNPELKNNDGLLANAVAEIENITYPVALAIIANFSKNTLDAIRSGQKIELDEIGELSRGIEGNVLFKQDEKHNYNKDAFGLSSFVSPMIERDNRKYASKPAVKFVNRREEEARPKKNKRVATWILVLIPLFIFSGWVSMKTQFWHGFSKSETSQVANIPEQNQNDFIEQQSLLDNSTLAANNDGVEGKITNIKPEKATFLPELSEPDILIDTKDKVMEKEMELELTPDPAPPVPEQVLTKKMYHLIGGSFENIENADILISSCKEQGYENSMVIGQAANGFYRVSIAAYLRKSEAITELEKVRASLNPNVWLLRQ